MNERDFYISIAADNLFEKEMSDMDYPLTQKKIDDFVSRSIEDAKRKSGLDAERYDVTFSKQYYCYTAGNSDAYSERCPLKHLSAYTELDLKEQKIIRAVVDNRTGFILFHTRFVVEIHLFIPENYQITRTHLNAFFISLSESFGNGNVKRIEG